MCYFHISYLIMNSKSLISEDISLLEEIEKNSEENERERRKVLSLKTAISEK